MSLRLRLLIVATLAIVALATAVAMVFQLVDDRASRELAAAQADDHAAVAALMAGGARGAHDELRARATAVLAPIGERHGGYCWSDGSFVEGMDRDGPPGPPPSDRGPPPGPPPGGTGSPPGGTGSPPGGTGSPPSFSEPGPPPAIRAALAAACRSILPGTTIDREIDDRGSVVVLAVRGIAPGVAAFSMRFVPGSHGRRWPPILGVIALAMLLVIAIDLHGVWQLRRGAAQLGAVLARLEADPRAAIDRPAPRELADVADGVRELAGRLADARARERELEHERARAHRMSSLGHLVAGIAHEVRNPLTGIKLVLDGIKRRSSDDKTRGDVDMALREVARLDKLVAQSLGVARDEGAERSELELGALVDERLAALAAHAGPRNVGLARRGTSLRLVDRDAIVRIVDNLVRNAIDASPDGGAVTVAIDGATIDVVDGGPGVRDGQALFEPFVTSKADGTGLGLWMSLALAEARGGTLRYRRTDGMTHFTLDLEPS